MMGRNDGGPQTHNVALPHYLGRHTISNYIPVKAEQDWN